MSWGHEIRQKLSPEEESALVDAVYNKYCACFSRYKKGMVMRSVRHELKKRHFAVGTREVRHLVLLTRACFW